MRSDPAQPLAGDMTRILIVLVAPPVFASMTLIGWIGGMLASIGRALEELGRPL